MGWLESLLPYAVKSLFVTPEPPAFSPNPAPGSPEHPATHHAVMARTLPPSPPSGSDAPERHRAGNLVLTLEFTPPPGAAWIRQRYEILVLPCLRPSGDDPRVFAVNYGRIEASLTDPRGGVILGILVALLTLLALGAGAREINGHQLPSEPVFLRVFRSLSPRFICQDAFGHMSFARFQVLLFTLALLGVYGYAFVLTGELPNVQPSVLMLAGITLGGATLASAATKPLVETGNRLWLLGNGLLDQPRRRPRWSDLLAGDGEVDITRVQALAFTLFAVGALIVRGAEDLSNFAVPEQIIYLIAISQTVYVAGKALPGDAPRRLNEELRSLRAAEQALLARPGDAAAQIDFDRQARAIAASLTDVFGERFRADRLDAHRRRVLAEADAARAVPAATSLSGAAAGGDAGR